jgi:hypothetical protein
MGVVETLVVDMIVHQTFVSPAGVFALAPRGKKVVARRVGKADTGENIGYCERLLGGRDPHVLGFGAVGPGYKCF